MKTLVLLIASCLSVNAQVLWKATWDTNPEPNCAGYRVLMGATTGRYTATNSVAGRVNNSVLLSNAPTTGVVYLVAVAYDENGLDGLWSKEITFTNKLSAPQNLKLMATIQAGLTVSGPWTNLASVNIPVPAAVERQQFYRTRLLLEEAP